jgi:hypothetical protein
MRLLRISRGGNIGFPGPVQSRRCFHFAAGRNVGPFDNRAVYFAGEIRGCGDNALFCLNEVFTTQLLSGQGLATVELTFVGMQGGVSLYTFKSLTYNFTSSEVPEPMTLTLLAAGLLGLGAKVKSRIRQRHPQL